MHTQNPELRKIAQVFILFFVASLAPACINIAIIWLSIASWSFLTPNSWVSCKQIQHVRYANKYLRESIKNCIYFLSFFHFSFVAK